AGREHGDLVPVGEPLRELAAVVLGSACDVRAVALDDEGELQVRRRSGEEAVGVLDGCWIWRRSRAFSAANSWTQANITRLTRRCRSKLSRLYSNSQRNIGIRMRRLTNRIREAGPGVR